MPLFLVNSTGTALCPIKDVTPSMGELRDSFVSVLRASRQGTPSGCYLSSNSNQVIAQRIVRKLSERIAIENPEVVDLYRAKDPVLTQAQIAEQLFPREFAQSPRIAEKAVGRAIRLLVPSEELREINAFRSAAKYRRMKDEGYFESDAFREQCRDAAKIRHELHSPDIDAMLAGRGRVAWSKEEKLEAVRLYRSPDYQLPASANSGRVDKNGLRPDCNKIAAELNRSFHDGQQVRRDSTVRSVLHEYKVGRLTLDD